MSTKAPLYPIWALVREIRAGVGITQSELAAASGVPQSKISNYERARALPDIPTLFALVEATGQELRISVAPADAGRPDSGPLDFGAAVAANEAAVRLMTDLEPSGDPAAAAPDARRVFETLSRHGVEYVLVGGYAAIAYGATRVTRDVDIVPRSTDENLARLAAALIELNAGERVEGETERLERPIDAVALRNELSTWRTDAGDIDVILWLSTTDGGARRYERLQPAVTTRTVAEGIVIAVASLEHVIDSKVALSREPDLLALPELRRLLARKSRDSRSG